MVAPSRSKSSSDSHDPGNWSCKFDKKNARVARAAAKALAAATIAASNADSLPAEEGPLYRGANPPGSAPIFLSVPIAPTARNLSKKPKNPTVSGSPKVDTVVPRSDDKLLRKPTDTGQDAAASPPGLLKSLKRSVSPPPEQPKPVATDVAVKPIGPRLSLGSRRRLSGPKHGVTFDELSPQQSEDLHLRWQDQPAIFDDGTSGYGILLAQTRMFADPVPPTITDEEMLLMNIQEERLVFAPLSWIMFGVRTIIIVAFALYLLTGINSPIYWD